MRPAFADEPVAYALFICTVVVWMIGELSRAARRRPNAANTDRYSLVILRVSIALGMLLAVQALRVSATMFGYHPVVFGIGLALMWAGIGIRWWCFRTLGRFFTFSVMTSADQPVITTGPYSLLRHPSYAGMLLALVGIGVTFGNWLSMTALLVLSLIGFTYRIRVEESALSATLGELYTRYASSRKRIIPFVW